MFVIGVECKLTPKGMDIALMYDKGEANVIEKMIGKRLIDVINEKVVDIGFECAKKVGVAGLDEKIAKVVETKVEVLHG
jgi:hypothetical protein